MSRAAGWLRRVPWRARGRTLRQRRTARLGARALLVLPLALSAVALATLLLWTSAGVTGALDRDLAVRALPDLDGRLDAAQAMAALQSVPPRVRVGNQRASAPFWLLIDLPPVPDDSPLPDVVVLRDRHLQSVELWSIDTAGSVAGRMQARRGQAPAAALGAVPRGFVIRLDQLRPRPVRLLARVTALGSATFWATQQDLDFFEAGQQRLERAAGLLWGAFSALALFSAVVAWHSRSRVFSWFAVWLMMSGALTAITLGHDYLVLDAWPAPRVEAAVKQLIVAGYAAASATLFVTLFRRPLAALRWLRPMRGLRRATLAACGLALVLTPALFLPLMYGLALIGLTMALAALARIVARTATPHARWYAAAWAAQFVAAAAEVFYAAGALPRLPGVSFENGTLVGALLTGGALAESLGHERRRRLRAQAKAERAARHYRHVYDAAPGGMLRLATDGRIVQMNRLAAEWLELAGLAPHELTVEAAFGQDKAHRLLADVLARDRASLEIVRLQAGDPGARRVRTFALEATCDGPDIAVALSDVSDRVELARTLHNMTMRDPLTQLLNRRGLEKRLAETIAQVPAGRPASFAHVDLDRFKLINDVFGHVAGDSVLQAVAARLRRAVPAGAVLARLGGDEFVAVLPDLDAAAARSAADRLVAGVTGEAFDVGDKRFEVAASVGVVEIAAQMSVKDVLACADRACMQAKVRGRGTVVTYAAGDGSLAAYQQDVRLADALRSGTVLSRLVLYGQPLVPIQAERPAALEVLLRMRSDDGRVQAPGSLILAAERAGEMATVDRFVLTHTLEHLAAYPEHAGALDFCAVNLSGASLNDARFVADACAMLAEHPQAASRLCLEVTESVALYDVDTTRRFIESMGRLGVRVALDDFGAGYTSFGYLKDLHAQYIKIDGAFVRDLLIQPTHRAITESIVELTHKLKMQSIAEWIEDEATMQALRGMGADFGQGYFFSPALPIETWLSTPMPRAAPPRASWGVLPFPGRPPTAPRLG